MQGEFSDENTARRYAALPVRVPEGTAIVQRWAAKHLKFSEVDGGSKLERVATLKPAQIVCISGGFDIWRSLGSAVIGETRARDRDGKLLQFALDVVGDVPKASVYSGRFCGVYTGDKIDDDGQVGRLVGMFDTPANRADLHAPNVPGAGEDIPLVPFDGWADEHLRWSDFRFAARVDVPRLVADPDRFTGMTFCLHADGVRSSRFPNHKRLFTTLPRVFGSLVPPDGGAYLRLTYVGKPPESSQPRGKFDRARFCGLFTGVESEGALAFLGMFDTPENRRQRP